MERSKILYDPENWSVPSPEAESIFEHFISSAEKLDYCLDFYEKTMEASGNTELAVEKLEDTYQDTEDALEEADKVISDLDLREIHLQPFFPDNRAVEEFKEIFGVYPAEVRQNDPDELYQMVKQTEEEHDWETRRSEREFDTLKEFLKKTELSGRSRLSIKQNKSAVNPLLNNYCDLEKAYRIYIQASRVIEENNGRTGITPPSFELE